MSIPYPLWIVVIVIISLLSYWGWKKYRETHPDVNFQKADSKKTEPKAPEKNKYGWVVTVALVVGVGLLTWWVTSLHEKETARQQLAVCRAVQLQEKWIFSQVYPNGEKRDFELEIKSRDGRELIAVVQEVDTGPVKIVAGIRLAAVGHDLAGTWVDYLREDNGEMSLKKMRTGTCWYGHYTSKLDGKIECSLEKVM